MTLLEKVRAYQELLVKKEELADQTKENNSAIEEAKQEIAQMMVDEDCPRITTGGYTFTLTPKAKYNKKSDEALAAEGIDFFQTLRAEGFEHLIIETVNAGTLSSTMKEYVEENGELTPGLESILNLYEFNDITRRKEAKKK